MDFFKNTLYKAWQVQELKNKYINKIIKKKIMKRANENLSPKGIINSELHVTVKKQ